MDEQHKDRGIIELQAPVREVTVLEDRASVRRKGSASLPAGHHLLRLGSVTPLVVDRTLNCRLGATEGARVVDVRMRRERTLKKTRPEQLDPLLERKEQLDHELELQEQRCGHQQRRVETAEAALEQWLASVAFEAGRGACDRDQWIAGMERLAALHEEALAAAAEHEGRLIELQEEQVALGQRLLAADVSTAEVWGAIELELALDQAQTIELVVEYLVPCAAWRPAHRAELAGNALNWTLLGTVWQRTGEPWQDIALKLSTDRSAAGVELPLLSEDRLLLRPKGEDEKFQVEVATRDEAIETLGASAEGPRSQDLPGVDDGGEVRQFVCPAPVSIPSNGLGHFLELASFAAQAQTDLIAFPELAQRVFIRSHQTNAAPAPLLAGPVQLVRDGVYSGTGRIDLVASGERFALGWGSLDDVDLVRKAGQHEEKASLTGWRRQLAWAEIYLSNRGDAARELIITERIPVSELEEVAIELLKAETSEGYALDDKGHLRWTLRLDPHRQKKVELRYRVQSHRSVVWR